MVVLFLPDFIGISGFLAFTIYGVDVVFFLHHVVDIMVSFVWVIFEGFTTPFDAFSFPNGMKVHVKVLWFFVHFSRFSGSADFHASPFSAFHVVLLASSVPCLDSVSTCSFSKLRDLSVGTFGRVASSVVPGVGNVKLDDIGMLSTLCHTSSHSTVCFAFGWSVAESSRDMISFSSKFLSDHVDSFIRRSERSAITTVIKMNGYLKDGEWSSNG